MNTRTAVVLFNLGAPDSSAAIEPFLFNLFHDRAILNLPQPLRYAAAKWIAHRRAPVTQQIYAHIGNASPLKANTEAQAAALRAALGAGFRVFVAMRHWHPRAMVAAAAVKAWNPSLVVLLPLYPQYSGTSTGSSLADWRQAASKVGLTAPVRQVCCYPQAPGFIACLARLISAEIARAPFGRKLRVLLSAHGLPKRIVERGDPYQWQVEATAAAIRAALRRPDIEARVCYQSRVGPLEWLGPSTESEIARAGAEGLGLVVAPIAFVSEHSETLVELDIDYRARARRAGVPFYLRAPTAGVSSEFIAELAAQVRAAPKPGEGNRRCPEGFPGCATALAGAKLGA
jgi:protoporphyrin/coproporphyrin ferrochelatase